MAGKRTPLRQRLVVAFVLLTAAVSGMFSLVTFVVMEELERTLFVDQLDGELRWWIQHLGNAPQTRPLELPNHAQLYITPDLFDAQLPRFLPAIAVGWQEIDDGKESYEVIRRDYGTRRYYLVQPSSEQERREQVWFAVLAVGTVSAWVAAYLIARLTAGSVLEPVLRLAQRVRRADPARSPQRLAAGFANDEIGALARAFEQRLAQLYGFIASERLFTSDVSHELRTPVAIISGAAETLLQRSELLPRARSAVERIATAAHEMQALIDGFLALGRDPLSVQASSEPCALNAIVRAEIERLNTRAAAGTRSIALIERSDVTLLCPATLLTVAVRNLLDNAMRYAPGSEVRVIILADALVVEDGGSGLSDADIVRAFDRHQRLAPEVAAGEGLGLAIVQRICERSGWQILAQSLPDGMRFELRFAAEPAVVAT